MVVTFGRGRRPVRSSAQSFAQRTALVSACAIGVARCGSTSSDTPAGPTDIGPGTRTWPDIVVGNPQNPDTGNPNPDTGGKSDPIVEEPPSTYQLADTAELAGFVECAEDQFLAGIATNDGKHIFATCTSYAGDGPHRISYGVLDETTNGSYYETAKWEITERPGMPVIDPLNPDVAYFTTHHVANDVWSWGKIDVTEAGPSIHQLDTAIGVYLSGVAVSPGGRSIGDDTLMACGASNFVNGEFTESQVTFFGTTTVNKLEAFPTGHKNLNPLAFAWGNVREYLFGIHSAGIDIKGKPDGHGSIVRVDPLKHQKPYVKNYPIAGGASPLGRLSVTQTDKGTIAAIASTAQDGAIYFANLSKLDELDAVRKAAGLETLDLPYIVLPDTGTGALTYINVAEFSPDGKALLACNLNSGMCWEFSLTATTNANPEGTFIGDGYKLDDVAFDSNDIGGAIWSNAGALIIRGIEIHRIPYTNAGVAPTIGGGE